MLSNVTRTRTWQLVRSYWSKEETDTLFGMCFILNILTPGHLLVDYLMLMKSVRSRPDWISLASNNRSILAKIIRCPLYSAIFIRYASTDSFYVFPYHAIKKVISLGSVPESVCSVENTSQKVRTNSSASMCELGSFLYTKTQTININWKHVFLKLWVLQSHTHCVINP